MNVHGEARPAPPLPRALDDDPKLGFNRNNPWPESSNAFCPHLSRSQFSHLVVSFTLSARRRTDARRLRCGWHSLLVTERDLNERYGQQMPMWAWHRTCNEKQVHFLPGVSHHPAHPGDRTVHSGLGGAHPKRWHLQDSRG